MTPHKLKIFCDRTANELLKKNHVNIIKALLHNGFGKVETKNNIHFCGMVCTEENEIAIFLPRQTYPINEHAAELTMRVLAKFGKESAERKFLEGAETGNLGLLNTLHQLSEDFRHNGLYSERRRIHSKNVGKPNWPRTILRGSAYSVPDTGEIFSEIFTTRKVDSQHAELAKIQAAILLDIYQQHGWWLKCSTNRRSELHTISKPTAPRKLWVKSLKAILPSLYQNRAISLAKNLLHYLQGTRGTKDGSFVWGIDDFHTVWEVMLKKTLIGAETGWNARLPRATYLPSSGKESEAPNRAMLTDVVLRQDKSLTIVDAKYYSAQSSENIPGWPDIAKQIFYDFALRETIGKGWSVKNCFAFPAKEDGDGPFLQVDMRKRNKNTRIKKFPVVTCHYLSITKVMTAYAKNQRCLTLPKPEDGTEHRKEESAAVFGA